MHKLYVSFAATHALALLALLLLSSCDKEKSARDKFAITYESVRVAKLSAASQAALEERALLAEYSESFDLSSKSTRITLFPATPKEGISSVIEMPGEPPQEGDKEPDALPSPDAPLLLVADAKADASLVAKKSAEALATDELRATQHLLVEGATGKRARLRLESTPSMVGCESFDPATTLAAHHRDAHHINACHILTLHLRADGSLNASLRPAHQDLESGCIDTPDRSGGGSLDAIDLVLRPPAGDTPCVSATSSDAIVLAADTQHDLCDHVVFSPSPGVSTQALIDAIGQIAERTPRVLYTLELAAIDEGAIDRACSR